MIRNQTVFKPGGSKFSLFHYHYVGIKIRVGELLLEPGLFLRFYGLMFDEC